MLSIIISSFKTANFLAVKKNICETIGIPYEIVKIDNPNIMGICEAYNKGANMAKFDHYLFLHEDILFHEDDWGLKILHHLSCPDTGVIGVAGGSYVPKAPCGWGTLSPYNHLSLIQNDNTGETQILYELDVAKIKALGIDGVFLAVSKETYLNNPFNEKIKGFHGYDLDFSLRIAKKQNNYIVGDILLEHFSNGNPDLKWLENNIQIRKELGNNFNKKKNSIVETELFNSFLRTYLLSYGFSLKNILKALYFYPLRFIKFKDHIFLMKHIHAYFKYQKDYIKKYGKFS